MFSSHVSKQFSAYCHDELPAEEARRVAEHLIGCTRCRSEFEEVKLGVKFAEQLPLVSAPDSLWQEVEALLDRNGRSIVRSRQWSLKSLITQPRFAVPAFVALLCVAFVIAIKFHRGPAVTPEARASWDVARLDGAPRIGSATVGDKGKLGIGQWLETD